MADVVTPAVRSRMMAGIRSKNTKPELLVRKELHRLGFRYRLHAKDIPGSPDFVLPRYRVAFFVNGCFWHGHNCHLFKLPSTRAKFWKTKIERNVQRDLEVKNQLAEKDWRRVVVWECALKGKMKLELNQLLSAIASCVTNDECNREFSGYRER